MQLVLCRYGDSKFASATAFNPIMHVLRCLSFHKYVIICYTPLLFIYVHLIMLSLVQSILVLTLYVRLSLGCIGLVYLGSLIFSKGVLV